MFRMIVLSGDFLVSFGPMCVKRRTKTGVHHLNTSINHSKRIDFQDAFDAILRKQRWLRRIILGIIRRTILRIGNFVVNSV